MINEGRIRTIRIVAGCLVVLGLLGYRSAGNARAEAPVQVAPTPVNAFPVVVYYFWGDGCPHCAATWVYWEEISREYPNLEIRDYEVWYIDGNQELLLRMAEAAGIERLAVPTIFIGDRHWVGSSDQIHNEITQ